LLIFTALQALFSEKPHHRLDADLLPGTADLLFSAADLLPGTADMLFVDAGML
jgi:hypothetical protein